MHPAHRVNLTNARNGFAVLAAAVGVAILLPSRLLAGDGVGIGASVSAPIVAEVDKRCDGYAASKSLKSYSITRVGVAGKAMGPWRLGSTASNAAVSERSDAWEADFASATVTNGKIVYASLLRSDSTGDGATGHEYCFVNGKLARTYLELDDVSEDQQWKHYVYYNADGSLLTTRTVYRYLGKGTHAQPSPTADLFEMPTYTAPAKLPFYAAYLKASAGTLPKL
jgi:hypothetical protein